MNATTDIQSTPDTAQTYVTILNDAFSMKSLEKAVEGRFEKKIRINVVFATIFAAINMGLYCIKIYNPGNFESAVRCFMVIFLIYIPAWWVYGIQDPSKVVAYDSFSVLIPKFVELMSSGKCILNKIDTESFEIRRLSDLRMLNDGLYLHESNSPCVRLTRDQVYKLCAYTDNLPANTPPEISQSLRDLFGKKAV